VSLKTTFFDAQGNVDKEKTESAAQIMRKARNKILANQKNKMFTTLFQKNREGNSYTRRVPYVRLTLQNINKVLDLTSPLSDGSQDQVLKDFRQDPSQFQEPMLILKRSLNRDGSTGLYVMLYLERKEGETVEQTF
jgi:hypothetical protein